MRSHLHGAGEGLKLVGKGGMVAGCGEKVGMAMPEWKGELCPMMNGESLTIVFKGKHGLPSPRDTWFAGHSVVGAVVGSSRSGKPFRPPNTSTPV